MSWAGVAGMYRWTIDRFERNSHHERDRHRIHDARRKSHRSGRPRGTATGGWAFRHGPETVAGDKFQLGRAMDDGLMLLGRRTWQLFSHIWPERDDPFSARMNAIPKLVVSRTLTDVSAWPNSQIIDSDPIAAVKSEHRDVIITGSLGIVQSLMAHDLIDEYRLLIFPTVLGVGEQLFPADRPPLYLECRSAEPAGAAILARYGRSTQRLPNVDSADDRHEV
jgi:dihydrofolate reductase